LPGKSLVILFFFAIPWVIALQDLVISYFIEPIVEGCMADMESSDESNHPIVAHHIAPVFDDQQEQEDLSSSMGMDDDVQNFICSTTVYLLLLLLSKVGQGIVVENSSLLL
jgi:hypothetical protein